MKKTYKLVDLDCANCAAKMERAIAELPEVKAVSVSFLKQKMSVELDDESIRDEVMDKIVKLIAKVEPDCELNKKKKKNRKKVSFIFSSVWRCSWQACSAGDMCAWASCWRPGPSRAGPWCARPCAISPGAAYSTSIFL